MCIRNTTVLITNIATATGKPVGSARLCYIFSTSDAEASSITGNEITFAIAYDTGTNH